MQIRDCRTRYNGDADQQSRRKKFCFPARLICADCFEVWRLVSQMLKCWFFSVIITFVKDACMLFLDSCHKSWKDNVHFLAIPLSFLVCSRKLDILIVLLCYPLLPPDPGMTVTLTIFLDYCVLLKIFHGHNTARKPFIYPKLLMVGHVTLL